MAFDKTLIRLEASRKQRPTRFHPEALESWKLVGYVPKNGAAPNKVLNTNLFDSIHRVKTVGDTIHAVGYANRMPTLLIFKSNKPWSIR